MKSFLFNSFFILHPSHFILLPLAGVTSNAPLLPAGLPHMVACWL